MLTLKKDEDQQNEKITATKYETDLEQWENNQLDIFSDIVISILLKENLNSQSNEE